MAGTVTFDTLTHSTAGSIATSYVVEGVCKGWITADQTGTAGILDSLNVSGITDNGTGDLTTAWSTNFANANYAPVGDGLTTGGSYAGCSIQTIAAGTVQTITQPSQSTGTMDCDKVFAQAVGELS